MIPANVQISVIFCFGIAAGLVETISPPNPTVLNDDEEKALPQSFRLLSKFSKLLLSIQTALRFLEGGLWIWAIFFSAVAFWKVLIIGLIGLLIGMKVLGALLGFILHLIFNLIGGESEDSEITIGMATVSILIPFFLTGLIAMYMVGMAFWIFKH